MTGVPQVELAKLHDEFPILNDLEGSVDFSVNDGEISPNSVQWNIDPGFQRHLIMLGIYDRISQLLVKIARFHGNCCCEGRLEFSHGRCEICW